jgi:hypothetical protein
MKLTPVGGTGQNATLSSSSSTIVNFEIPNNVVNLSLSKLVYDIGYSVSAASLTPVQDALGLSVFDRITLSTRSGVVLANADNMGQFCHLISKIKTKVTDLVDNPSTQTTHGKTQALGAAITNLACYPQQSSNNSSVGISKTKPYSDICKSNGNPLQFSTRELTVAGTGGLSVISNLTTNCLRMDGSTVSTPFLEPLHFISLHTENVTTSTMGVSYQLSLSSVKDTLLEVNKSLYFGDNLILSLSFNPASKFCFKTTRLIDNSAGSITTAAPPVLTVGTAASYAFTPFAITGAGVVDITDTAAITVTVNNLALYVAVETDPIITAQLINKVNSDGFSMTIPYVYCTKTPITVAAGAAGGASTNSFAMQQRITRGYGQRLLRCYTSIFGSETIANSNQCIVTGTLPKTVAGDLAIIGFATRAFTINQHNDTPLSAYNTTLDGIRLQDFTLSAEDATHYLVNEPYLRGSCIINVEQYKNQCVHIDSWTGNPVCMEDDTTDNGLSLDSDKTYGITYNTLNNITSSTQLNHYLFFVVQRTLMIRGNQISLM